MKHLLTISFLLVALNLASCKKADGLSKDTGNLEISVPGIYSWSYKIYIESEFRHFQNFEPAIPFREGVATKIIIEKELLRGNYGIHFFQNGTGHQKAFQIVPNKVNKYTMP